MMSNKGRQEIPDKQIVNPPTLEQRIRKDINRAALTRENLAYVMSLKTVGVGDKPEAKPSASLLLVIAAVRRALSKKS